MAANSPSLRGKRSMRIRILRGDRYRPIPVLPQYTAENPALGSHPGFSVMGRTATRAALPRPSWEASLRGFQTNRGGPFSRMFRRRRSGLLMLGFWMLMMMGYCMRPGLSIPRSSENNYGLNDVEDFDVSPPERDFTWSTFISFLFPSTCIPKENQDSKTCNVQQTLNQSECLRYKCCYSPFGTDNNNCLTLFKDTRMFPGEFGLGMIYIIILGTLPIFCCSLCRRRKCVKSLRRKGTMIAKNLKKKQNKLKRFFKKYVMRDGGGGGNGRKQEPEDFLYP